MLRWTPKTMQDTLDVLEHMQDRFQTTGRIDLDKVIASCPRPGWGSWKEEATPHNIDQNPIFPSQKKIKWPSAHEQGYYMFVHLFL